MAQPLIIFGAGKIAQAASYYFERDSHYRLLAYACDAPFRTSETFLSKPLLAADDLPAAYPPGKNALFVALGYQGINRLRADKVAWARELGYGLASYRSPHVPGDYSLGENSIVMDGAAIQPAVTLGDDVFVWGGAMIGHHTQIGDHCWLTGGCAIGGASVLGAGSFVGLNATIGHEITLGERCLLGAHTATSKPLPAGSVVIAADTEPHRLNADQFVRLSACFRL
ncbi:hypothetical protein [Halochromatium glycolicum]|uniref:Sugar O-acyltransferase, sialic acid O-acetyltransferase NeuD family n=1 Tax=Halochromatium glycolicum TaxID=85075 RepID=A0AAJ0U192_9GAMM|nr:hypothetical protein [Halochromatium glycolicum]MBK1703373.1 hypothetical protein [Halochromatium glycolicum]